MFAFQDSIDALPAKWDLASQSRLDVISVQNGLNVGKDIFPEGT